MNRLAPPPAVKPIETIIQQIDHDLTLVVRRWSPGDPKRCTRCEMCRAYQGHTRAGHPTDREVCAWTVRPEDVYTLLFGK